MKANNDNLRRAKRVKNDEFYTFYEDIENELQHYLHHFKDKVILCPCDDWSKSNFYKYFKDNFDKLGLKKLITVCYNANGRGVLHILTKDEEYTIILQGDGDFRNQETIDLIEQSDIVVTNPPFSLFRDFVNILMEHDKKFLIIGNKNALTSKTIFPLIRDNKIWLGHTSPKLFYQPLTDETKNVTCLTRLFGNITWFSDLHTSKNTEVFDTGVTYEQGAANGWYLKYDNYDAINVNKVSQIPMDYNGVMGVPITFIDKYIPEQFDIVGLFNGYTEPDYDNGFICGELADYIKYDGKTLTTRGPVLNTKAIYARVLIKPRFEIVGLATGNSRACGFYGETSYTPHPDDRGGCPILDGKRVYSRLLIKRK